MALATLEILNAHGINISLDDFGSGKMSLGFLKDSHASMIKFDNSLVKKSRTVKYGKSEFWNQEISLKYKGY